MNSTIGIYKGDDTSAFGGLFIRINLHLPSELEGVVITKAVVSINVNCNFLTNDITKVYENPTFPLDINLDSTESKKLQSKNYLYLAVWDQYGRKHTPDGHLVFDAYGCKVKD